MQSLRFNNQVNQLYHSLPEKKKQFVNGATNVKSLNHAIILNFQTKAAILL